MEPRWDSDPDRRKQKCVACFAGLYVDETGHYCQDCRGVIAMMHRLFHGEGSSRMLWGKRERREHEARVQAHAELVAREYHLAEAV